MSVNVVLLSYPHCGGGLEEGCEGTVSVNIISPSSWWWWLGGGGG